MKTSEMSLPELVVGTIRAALGQIDLEEEAALIVANDAKGEAREFLVASPRGLATVVVEPGEPPALGANLRLVPWRDVSVVVSVVVPPTTEPEASMIVRQRGVDDILVPARPSKGHHDAFDTMLRLLLDRTT